MKKAPVGACFHYYIGGDGEGQRPGTARLSALPVRDVADGDHAGPLRGTAAAPAHAGAFENPGPGTVSQDPWDRRTHTERLVASEASFPPLPRVCLPVIILWTPAAGTRRGAEGQDY